VGAGALPAPGGSTSAPTATQAANTIRLAAGLAPCGPLLRGKTGKAVYKGNSIVSRRNGDRARFQKDRKRKMLRRGRIQAMLSKLRGTAPSAPPDTEHPRS
jgi:hypothetical protein